MRSSRGSGLAARTGAALVAAYVLAAAAPAAAQAIVPGVDQAAEEELALGELEPGRGFRITRSELGALNLSAYFLVRYLNQLPPSQTFVDHLGRERPVDTRNDLHIHRIMIHLLGWVYTPELTFQLTVWTVTATEQVAVIGNVGHKFSDAFELRAGVGGLPGTRTMLQMHPYFLGTDRFMADEFFRPGFTHGIWASGEPLPRLRYHAMLGNNLSALGISAAQLTRDFAGAISVWWMPTTGEFGPRGGFNDFEYHERVATRFGASYTHSREDRFAQLSQPGPDNTQIRLSDSVLFFETGALAEGVTVEQADFDLFAVDAGVKYRGFHLQAEAYLRYLTDFDADGPLPISTIRDQGFYVQGAYQASPQRLTVFGLTSFVFGEFNDSWEVGGGFSIYPWRTRNIRFQPLVQYVHRSSASSLFGYYIGGTKGPIVSLALDTLF